MPYNNYMYISGKNDVIEYIESGNSIKKLFIKYGEKLPDILVKLIRKHNIDLVYLKREELDNLVGHRRHRGIAAKIPDFSYASYQEITDDIERNNGIALYLDHINDPVNLGSIIRSAVGFDISGIILPQDRQVQVTPSVIRVSEGNCFKIKIAKITNPIQFIKRLKKAGIWIASLDMNGENIKKANLPRPLLLIAGAEGRGVSSKIIELSDYVLSIPQSKNLQSLNVAVAVAIALFAIRS